MQKLSMYVNASSHMLRRAASLRSNETLAEKQFWAIVRKNQIAGYKFRRQHAIAHFVVDFYCHKLSLVIELDGGIHNLEEIKQYDSQRQKQIEGMGLRVHRFSNDEVLESPKDMKNKLLQIIQDIESQNPNINQRTPIRSL